MKKVMIKIILVMAIIVCLCGCSQDVKEDELLNTTTEEGLDYSSYSSEELLTESDIWPSLCEVYEEYFPLGAAIPQSMLQYTLEMNTAKKNFNSYTCENEMKPTEIHPLEDVYDFTKAQGLVDLAIETNARMVGHVLVWYSQTPDWFFEDENGEFLDPENQEHVNIVDQRMKDHIYTVVKYYEDQGHVIERWDVVNEAILETDVNENGFRSCHWYTYLGEEYIDKAFQYAYEADMLDGEKNIRLFYNDYQNYNLDKREYIYNLLERLVEDGVPIDGVGLQCHIGLEDPSIEVLAETIDMYADLDLDVEITEIDVTIYDKLLAAAPEMTSEINVSVGYRYLELFEMLKEKADKLTGVTLWGFYDGSTWLNMAEYAAFTPGYPLPFDKLLNPKWAYWAMVAPEVLPDESEGIVDLVQESRTGELKYTEEAPVIDGERDELYNSSKMVETLNCILRPTDGSEAANGKFELLWDDEYLYAFVEVTDSVLNRMSAQPHEQDSIEIFVDENNQKTSTYEDSGDMQYRVNFQNWVTFNGKDSKYEFESVSIETETGYIVEARWKPQTIKLEDGITLGMDFQVNDAGEGGFRQGIKTWSAVDNTGYTSTSVYGEMTLVK